jgi:hypothetical protein
MCDSQHKSHKETPLKPSHEKQPNKALKITEKEKWDPQACHTLKFPISGCEYRE